MRPRAAKRPRLKETSTYKDTISFFEEDSYHVVYETESHFNRVSNQLKPAPVASVLQDDTDFWEKASSWLPSDDPNYALDPTGEWYDEVVECDVMQDTLPPSLPESKKKKKKRTQVSTRPHIVWKNLHRNTYLDEMLRWAGRGDFRVGQECPDCISRCQVSKGRAEFRCEDCFQPDLLCLSCCLKRHRMHPFHRVGKWDGIRFVEVSLKSLGLRIQLNHGSMHCDNPSPCHSNFAVIHTNGIHDVAVDFCNCSRALPQHIQLLRRRLYPASQINIKTCASFELLDLLHKFALTTKASTYDFYRALDKKTNNTGIVTPKYRYRALYRMILQWRHLKMLKWAGRAHDPTGADGTKEGELALRCPSCPYPGINLPAGWDSCPDEDKYLYMAFLCMDANFRLKNQLVSNWSQDPGLGVGLAYMVPRKEYEDFLLSRVNDTDISTCVGFQALAQANTKSTKGLRYTGVGGVFCGRSEMVLPNAVGNLPKGERYATMDYIFARAARLYTLLLLLISYDICCQWFVNVFHRMSDHWPDELKVPQGTLLTPAIPKLHEPMHLTANHQMYSLNYIPGVGASDLECPERFWAGHNALGNSTKTQGPGSRHDVLDDHFNFWNWQKYIGLGKTLMRKYKAALAERNIQSEGHRGLSQSVQAHLVKKWEAICTAWESDAYPKTKPNPFDIEGSSLSEAQVRKQLAAEEKQRLKEGGIALHDTSAHAFLGLGLDLEDTQRRIRRLAKDTTAQATAKQEGGLTEQRNQLHVCIKAWEQLLPIYMPGLLQYQLDLASGKLANATSASSPVPAAGSKDEAYPENHILWFPSSVATTSRGRVCVSDLPEIEERLRTAQCFGALDNLRHVLRIKTRLVAFKNKHLRGQREGTRSRAVIDRVHERARSAATKYRAAREAKLALSGPGDWEKELMKLEDQDVRGYQDPNRLKQGPGRRGTLEDDHPALLSSASQPCAVADADGANITLFVEERSRRDGTGETRRTLSWIWTNGTSLESPEDATDEILRAEWAKSRSRSDRATEEVQLLREEMRRTLEFLDWKAGWWRQRKEGRTADSALREGLAAYAAYQADLQTALAEHFRQIWRQPLEDKEEEKKQEMKQGLASSTVTGNSDNQTPLSKDSEPPTTTTGNSEAQIVPPMGSESHLSSTYAATNMEDRSRQTNHAAEDDRGVGYQPGGDSEDEDEDEDEEEVEHREGYDFDPDAMDIDEDGY